MNIWAFPSFYPSDAPGKKWHGIFAHRQYKGLIENGATLKVIIPVKWKPPGILASLSKKWSKLEGGYPLSRVYDGIEVYHPRIANFLPHLLDRREYQEKYYRAIADFFIEQGIDLHPSKDIFFSQWLPDAVLVQYAAHKLGVKSAILSIGDDIMIWPHHNPQTLASFKNLMIGADMRFACADYLGREANKLIGRDLPYEVVNWGVDYDFFKPSTVEEKVRLREKYNLPQDKLLVLNVGSAIIRKGWLDLFDALKLTREKTDNFAIVAVHAGEIKVDLDKEVAKRGLSDIFFNLHEVPPSQLNEVFKAVDIFCLPSHWEGLANANIEAMSSGLPVITTDVCGHPELITSYENGILVPPKNVEVLYKTLLEVVTNEALRKKLSENGRNFIVNKWGNFADNSRLLYKELSAQ